MATPAGDETVPASQSEETVKSAATDQSVESEKETGGSGQEAHSEKAVETGGTEQGTDSKQAADDGQVEEAGVGQAKPAEQPVTVIKAGLLTKQGQYIIYRLANSSLF